METVYRVTFRPDESGDDTVFSRVIAEQPAQLERDLDAAACVISYEVR